MSRRITACWWVGVFLLLPLLSALSVDRAPATTSKPTSRDFYRAAPTLTPTPTAGFQTTERPTTQESVFVWGNVPFRGPIPYHEDLAAADYLLFAGLSPTEIRQARVTVLSPDGTVEPLTSSTTLSGGETLLVLAPKEAPVQEEEAAAPEAAMPLPEEELTTDIRVTGAVEQPGAFPYRPDWTLTDYVLAAGGFTEEAEEGRIWIRQVTGDIRTGTPTSRMRPGDTILVSPRLPGIVPATPEAQPPSGLPTTAEETLPAKITVLGAVLRETAFFYQPALAVEDYLRLAGGTTDDADEESILVVHRDGTSGGATEPLRPGDLIFVPRITAKPTVEALEQEDAARRRAEEEARLRALVPPSQLLRRYGTDYFEPARRRMEAIEKRVEALTREGEEPVLPEGDEETTSFPSSRRLVQDAITGYVGPIDLLNAEVLMSVTRRETLKPNDVVHLIWWSPSSEKPPEQATLVVQPDGKLVLPGYGELVVVGMTLDKFEENVRELLARQTFTDLQVVATFNPLETLRIPIVGHAFRPGTYLMGDAATLFNALYFCGGPSESGSLRNIILKRGEETYKVDFYRYLLYGESDGDRPLRAGDVIYIGPVGRQVSIGGEVVRPGIYELAEGEGLAELLEMAGGIRSSGFAKSIQIDSVRDQAERVLYSYDATGDLSDAPPLKDGDHITVFSVLSEPTNTIQLVGYVRHPRVYELKEGMRVADAIRQAGGLRKEAFTERMDLLRLNPDGETRTLIPIDLAAALRNDPNANIPLRRFDRLVVYRRSEVEWFPPRQVSAQGAVARPGTYPRADGMRLSDLLRLAGGVLAEAYRDRALLMRMDAHNRLAVSIPIDLTAQDEANDPILQDGDVLLVLRYEEAVWEPARVVRVTGAVQQPGLVPFLENMRVTDALIQAGGVLGDVADVALLLRKAPTWDKVAISRVIQLKAALEGSEEADLLLQPEDEIVVYRRKEIAWEPAQQVSIMGAVQSGGVYPRTEGMRISDLLFRAGGILPNAYLDRADLVRYLEDYETRQTIAVNLREVLAGNPDADLPLQDGDMLRVATLREARFTPEEIVTIYGAVQFPDVYPWTKGMRFTDVLFLAGDVLPGSRAEAEIARARSDGMTEITRVNIEEARNGGPANVEVYPGDIISVMKSRTFYDVPRMVTIRGEVRYPGTYALQGDETISDLIKRAGGFTEMAYPAGATLEREPNVLLSENRRMTLQDLWKMMEDRHELEFYRSLAKARVDAQRAGATLEPLTEVVSQAAVPVTSALGAGLAASEANGEDSGAVLSPAPSEAGGETSPESSEILVITPDETSGTEDTSEVTSISTSNVASVDLVTRARKVENLVPTNQVVIDLVAIMANPHGEEDILLEPGDVLFVPRQSNTVLVTGMVASPKSLVYRSGFKVEDYLRLAGGVTEDGNADEIVVTKMNGRSVHISDLERIEPGDAIVVPPKVLVERISNRWDRVAGFLRFALTTVATAIVVKAAIQR